MNVKVFIENHEMKFQTVKVITGLGPLAAEIVLPPGEKRRRILPGSRVNAFMQCKETNWQWVWWFRGYTTNFPAQAIGMDMHPVVLNVESEISVLKSVLMSYLVMGQDDISDLKVREKYFSGNVALAQADCTRFFSFYDIADSNIGFGNRILGILQGLMALNPSVWEQARRSRCLDYLVIETNDQISEDLDKAVVFGGLIDVLGKINAPSFSAMDVLAMILQYIFHDFVSVAPFRCSDGGKFRSPRRDSYGYMPKDVEWWNMPEMGANSLMHGLTEMDTPSYKLFDHIIKPAYETNPVIATNDITMSQYETAYVQEMGNTRTTMKLPTSLIGKPSLVVEMQAPESLNSAHDIVMDMLVTLNDKQSTTAGSNLLAHRTSGIRTNEERVLNKVIHTIVTGDTRLTSVLYGIGNKYQGTDEEKRNVQDAYLKQYTFFEHAQTQGVDIEIPGAVYKPEIMPGFYTYIHGRTDDELYVGKIMQKVDTYDLASSTCSSSYAISRCIKHKNYDFNNVKPDADFSSLDSTFDSQIYGVDTHPVFENMPPATVAAFRSGIEYVPFQRALTHLGVKEGVNKSILEPEKRASEYYSKDDPKKKYGSDLIGKECFYGPLDMLPAYPDSIINGYRPDNLLIPEDAYNALFTIGNAHSVSSGDLVKILDAKNMNYFSFASIIVGAAIPPEKANMLAMIAEMKNVTISELPLWEGNPFPQRIDLLLYYLSSIEKADWAAFMEKGTVPKYLKGATIPRPLSDRQLIALRKAVAEAAYNER